MQWNFSKNPAAPGWKQGFCVVVLVLAVGLAGAIPVRAHQAANTPRAGEIDAVVPDGLPSVLSQADARLYREIFALQENGGWDAADHRIERLGDPVLLGHVMAQRYLHPTAYRSKYRELKAWLDSYADHPEAKRIYRLAKKRRPSGAQRPRQPERISMDQVPPANGTAYRSTKRLGAQDRRRARALLRQVRRNVLRTRLTVTEKLLAGPEAHRLLDHVEIDEAFARVAAGWFYYGKPERAYRLASAAADRSGTDAPMALWMAGLSAWRLGELDAAVRYFEGLAQSKRASAWTMTAGAYWAARAHLRLRNPAEVSGWLVRAAAYPRTFYGLLARRALGMDIAFPGEDRALSEADIERLGADPASHRALALLQVGQRGRAESELKRLDGDGDPALATALLTLDELVGFPALALQLADGLSRDEGHWTNGGIERGLYPIPPWRPENGFRVDRALVYAFMRQESRFKPRAKSRDGARGLMQVLPSTANYVVRERRFRGASRSKLFDPHVNIEVGQRYIAYLLAREGVDGDLFRLTVAYNGGPGNLNKWRRRLGDVDDALLFIESLPSRETRLFIERVLANFWIYRARLGQPLPSLDAIAAGDWPTYISLDRPVQAAEKP